ncbi:MAG: tetratricopeptide repeat protein, partial [Bacteroidales bacterium]|nr:tetratricopeptide repeat protein [Bacteroidales bacterium]
DEAEVAYLRRQRVMVPDVAEIENMLVSAVEKYDNNDFKGAEAILKKITASDSSNDAAWYYLAQIAAGRGDLELAEEYLRLAAGLDTDNFWYRYRLARLYALTSRQELASQIYEKLLQDFPKKSELYFDLTELYSAQKEYDKALATLDEIQTVFGMTESIAVYRFNLLRMMERHEEAFKSLEEYNREFSSPYVLSTLADYQMAMYNDTTALAYYDEALDIAPDYIPAVLGKAEVLRMTRRYSEYFPVLYKFAEEPAYPVQAKTDYLMALVQRTENKFLTSFRPQIDTVFMKAVDTHPLDSTLLQTAGFYYYSTGRNDLAENAFRKNMETYPSSLAASANFVEFLMYSQNWKELSEEGRKAFSRFPEETAFLEMAGVGDYNLKEYDKVTETCRTILDIAPRDSSRALRAWSTMGDVYHEMGESKKAFSAYEKALKINPDYVYVLNNYAYYLSVEGKKLKKAYAMSKKTVEAEPDNATYLDTFGWILFIQGKALEAKPFFKHAMLYGGNESAVILDHYAEVLYALKEYDMAFVYWNLAKQKNDGSIPDLDEKIRQRKQAVNE